MRLTDLLRDKNKKSRKPASRFDTKPVVDDHVPEPEPPPQKNDHASGHLQANDLSSLYDLDTNQTSPQPERLSRQQAYSPPPQAPAYDPPPQAPAYVPPPQAPAYVPPPPVQAQPAQYSPPPPQQPPVQPSAPVQVPPPPPVVEPAPKPPAIEPVSLETQSNAAAPLTPPVPATVNPPLDQAVSQSIPKAPPPPGAATGDLDQQEEMAQADGLHIELLTQLDDLYTEGQDGSDVYIERLIAPLADTIEFCKHSNALLRKAIRLKKERSFTTHSLNVSILAIKLGLIRGYSDEKVFSVALCALMSDIGMTRVDPAILNKAGKLTQEEFMEIKRHVQYSVDIANTVTAKFPFLAPIVYQIHERENGSGYPEALKGANIHEFAKIIGMCDVYIALTEPKANRENYSGYVAMQQIISRRGIDFDAKIIKSLIDVISVFPLESLVMLNNAAIGRVVDISAIHPTRPKLSILINSDGEKLKRPTYLDLEKEPLLYIEGPDVEEGVVL